MFLAIYLIVVFASWAMLVREGLWSNAISLVNILVSGLVAFAFYSPLAIRLDDQFDGQYTYVLDFLCIWALFVASMIVSRLVTGAASKTRMRFKHPIDPVGGPLVGLMAAWVLSTFVMATLHTSPMPKDAFGGKLIHTESEVETASALTSPDLGWLRFVERASAPTAFGSSDTTQFRAWRFVQIYEDHRTKLEASTSLRVTRG